MSQNTTAHWVNAYILLGANLGDKVTTFSLARQLIAGRCGEIIKQSLLYESVSWGFDAPGFFLNQVLLINTKLTADDLLSRILLIENELGRKREFNRTYTSRTIDIDILYYGNEVIENERLSVPHPRLHLRRFTLMPLCEMSPSFIHPVLKKSHEALLFELNDKSDVRAVEKLSD